MDAHKVLIWDRFVRSFHWSLVVAMAAAWLTGDEYKSLHEWLGYFIVALLACRLVWGCVGSPYARFRQFVASPTRVVEYLRAIIRGDEKRFLGHNPAGAAMIIALLLTIAGTAFTGWLQTTDAFFGSDLVSEAHVYLSNFIILLIALHVAGVFVASYRHKENLVRSMVTGVKRPAEGDDIALSE